MPRFYKYRRVNSHAQEIIVDNKLFFANPRDFEDKNDCAITPNLRFQPSIQKRLVSGAVKDRYPNLNRKRRREEATKLLRCRPVGQIAHEAEVDNINKILLKTGVCCFSDKANSLKLWRNYADDLRGLCLVFQAEYFNAPLDAWSAVNYVDVVKPFHHAEQMLRFGKQASHRFKDWCLTKGREFSWEHECRAIGDVGLHSFPPSWLHAVILGPRISTDDEKKVRHWVESRTLKPLIVRAIHSHQHDSIQIPAID
jgi:hypothetical protein